MPYPPDLSPEAVKLRRRAEAKLRQRAPVVEAGRTPADMLRLIHELEVHQIELEMQNAELNRAREEMEAGLEKYGDLFDFAPVAYLTLDREGTIREANLRSGTLLGIERARLVTRRLGLLMAAADRPAFHDLLTRVFASDRREACEVALLREGQPSVEVRIEAAKASSGLVCRVVLLDLTEQKRAEADRLIVSKLESTGILAGGIAHDFNNLLTVILLDLDLAGLSTQRGSVVTGLLEEAKQGILRAQTLTAKLITFADGGVPVRKPANVAEVVRESVRQAVEGSALQTAFTEADGLWRVEVDHGQFAQVIRNVVLNVRDAMPQGGVVSIRVENVVRETAENATLPAGRYVRVSIADQGGGIPADVLPKIFDPYFSTKQRGNQKGMGLGLTICHAIVRKHGGGITVRSDPGVGATLQIDLPACEPARGEAKSPGAKPAPRRRPAAPGNISEP